MATKRGKTTCRGWEEIDLATLPARVRRWVEQDLGDGWTARAELVEREGRLEITDLHLTGPGGLDHKRLRQVSTQTLKEYGQRRAREDWGVSGLPVSTLDAAPSRPGRRGHPREFYAKVAELYAEEAAGSDRRVNVRVALRLGEGYTAKQVAAYVGKARALDLLTAATKGKGGGELTAVGRAVMAGIPVAAEGEIGLSEEMAAAGRRGVERARWR